ncbi:LysR family transcriptional regulator [Sphingomonas yabuuchiae]|uniref:DNA-binding transcriptional LysR family regulator n=1 Tax=Sphingomonas yabuuchiae TaxID=172044 RepID=A0AA40ZW49_9SPHN|nr:LysR family transcriptional regulator [Sphingomonas yabuuchiae]MBB4610722.1 DNA-binding transcriptional LysR family regulator [Sphingomonas yabuuchiae]MBN3557210.1 LysR family transcriptional regulator [Sphingomonas yabuuchiae]
MIDLRQLQLFVSVAEELHFGRAAAKSGMSQPPFSQQILRLERKLGVALLHRTSRHVSLTPAGMALLVEARALIARRDRIVDMVRRTASGDAGTLRIGFAASSAVGVLPIIVRDLRLALPDVNLQIDDRDGIDIAAAIRLGTLDAAIVRGPFPAKDIMVETLYRDGLVAVLPGSHPLAGRTDLAINDLAVDNFILFPRTGAPELYDTIIGLCSGAGFSPAVVQEASAWLSVVGLVEAGLGITIAPALAARGCPQGVAAIPVTGTFDRTELLIAYRQGELHPLVARFREIALSAMQT